MPNVTPTKNITAGGRNFDAGVTYSVADDLAALMEAELSEESAEASQTPQEPAEAVAEPVAEETPAEASEETVPTE